MTVFSEPFTSDRDTSQQVEELGTSFKSGFLDALNTKVQSKMISQRFNQPLITRDLKRLSKRKDRAYKRLSKIHSTNDYSHYKDLKNAAHMRCKLRYNEYVNIIVMNEDHKPKRLLSFIKS